jgi:DNA gyrase subunit B
MDSNANQQPAIKYLTVRDHVRLRPGMYVGGVDSRGLHHLIYEILDYMADQAVIGRCSIIEIELLDDDWVIIRDNSHGLPVPHYWDKHLIWMEIPMGGSGDWLLLVNALSSDFHVQYDRVGFRWEQTYRAGIPDGAVIKTPLDNPQQSGTNLRFRADDTIFETVTFDYERIARRAQELAYLIGGLRVSVHDRRIGQIREDSFHYPDGLKAWVADQVGTEDCVGPLIHAQRQFDITKQSGKIIKLRIDMAFQFSTGSTSHVASYLNSVETPLGGTHLEAFKQSLVKALNDSGDRFQEYTQRTALTSTEVETGLTAIIAVLHPDPIFAGSTRVQLLNEDVGEPIERLVREALESLPEAELRSLLKYLYDRRG